MNRAEGYNHLGIATEIASHTSKEHGVLNLTQHNLLEVREVSQYTLGFGEWSRSSPQPAKGHPGYGTQHEQRQGHLLTEGYSRGREFNTAGRSLCGIFFLYYNTGTT